jgi:hypothetical protein
MKCRGAILAGLVILAASAGKLAGAEGRLAFGFKGGINLADVTGNGAAEAESKVCFSGGAFGTYRLSRVMSLQPEILYARKGSDKLSIRKEKLRMENVPLVIDCVDVPLLLRFYFPSQNELTPGFFFGPAVSFTLAGDLRGEMLRDEFGQPLQPPKWDVVNIKKISLSVVLGAGVEVDGGPFDWLLEFRFSPGLSRFTEPAETVVVDDGIALIDDDGSGLDLKHGAFSLMAGVIF